MIEDLKSNVGTHFTFVLLSDHSYVIYSVCWSEIAKYRPCFPNNGFVYQWRENVVWIVRFVGLNIYTP